MSFIRGCQEGKYTPQLTEIRCPKCGAEMEIFVNMQSKNAGTLHEEAVCDSCGAVFPEGMPVSEMK